MNKSLPRNPGTPVAGSDTGPENIERLEARLYHEIQINRGLKAELRHHQAVLRDYLTLGETGPDATARNVLEVAHPRPSDSVVAFLQGECAGLRMRLEEQRILVPVSLSHIQPEEHHAARFALAQALTLKEEAESQVKTLRAQLNDLLQDNTHRELIMESMAAQLEVRDERIGALEASFENPELIEPTLETQALQDALLQLQEQVVTLSEELAAHAFRATDES